MNPFNFTERLSRLPYALWSLSVLVGQYLAMNSSYSFDNRPPIFESGKSIMILFDDLLASNTVMVVVGLTLVLFLAVAWALVALAFRRAIDCNASGWIAPLAMVPIVQIPVILYLCVAPSRAVSDRPRVTVGGSIKVWRFAAQGALVGVGLTVGAVAIAALVFGTYSYGMFVVSPLVAGMTAAYLANRKTDIGKTRTFLTSLAALAIGSVALILAALEGIICIVMAAPLAVGFAFVGSLAGRSLAMLARPSTGQNLSAIALLPLVFAWDAAVQPTSEFASYQTAKINAPAGIVWQSIVDMGTIEETPALPFLLGVAYPVSGQIFGKGVGAKRHGVFSTGTAVERITEWVPEKKLAYVVVEDVPALIELSPYEHVYAPHAVGYFRTLLTSFELHAKTGETTEIILQTSHELKIDPAFYWLPITKWVVLKNNARVLAHIKRRAERSIASQNALAGD